MLRQRKQFPFRCRQITFDGVPLIGNSYFTRLNEYKFISEKSCKTFIGSKLYHHKYLNIDCLGCIEFLFCLSKVYYFVGDTNLWR